MFIVQTANYPSREGFKRILRRINNGAASIAIAWLCHADGETDKNGVSFALY